MTINIKIINEDTNPTRSVHVDTSENGATAPTVLIPAGGDKTFMIHNTKQLTISELQHPAAEQETLVEKIVDAVEKEVKSVLGIQDAPTDPTPAAPAPEAPTPTVEAPLGNEQQTAAVATPNSEPESTLQENGSVAPAASTSEPTTEPAATPAA